MRTRRGLGFLVLLLFLFSLVGTSFAASEEFERGNRLDGPMGQAFRKAAEAYGVPVELLVALAYAETRLDDHDGVPSVAGGYGVMHLVSNPEVTTLEKAAGLTGLDPGQLKTDTAANIMGGAALLASYAADLGHAVKAMEPGDWFEAVARYSQLEGAAARDYALQVYEFLNRGIDVEVDGEEIRIEPQAVEPDLGEYANLVTIQSQDYGPAAWVPAHSSNYTASNRPSSYPIRYIVIHVTQGSYAGAISWFQNPSSNVSAHYVIRSSDGAITQMVREKDIAWHAGNWTYNTQSIGIEHEGWVRAAPGSPTPCTAPARALTRNIALKYGIPMNRNHIIGHNEVPGATPHRPGQLLGLELLHEPGHPVLRLLVRHRGQHHQRPLPGEQQLGHLLLVQPALRQQLPVRQPGAGQRRRLLQVQHPEHRQLRHLHVVPGQQRLQRQDSGGDLAGQQQQYGHDAGDGARQPADQRRQVGPPGHLPAAGGRP